MRIISIMLKMPKAPFSAEKDCTAAQEKAHIRPAKATDAATEFNREVSTTHVTAQRVAVAIICCMGETPAVATRCLMELFLG
ncbi:hypothetical protein LWC08_01360 [Desulfobaculum bizertense]|uniref:hypothetical protein n=1 Tax=Desulfobaculum bizertense TaxID=376490 RepID=UPI001F3946D9|nr:hypothetical protein [Desulfobaculum bizertense]UIJ38235.1 hypothetical protein LWC08_01360 [Desulfobaculum bizertense]